ncbi:hypothetical protein ON010_g16939 [Phytophthora cinnamomi]|nr:hypothetical protein ON010_g16939 [Phytophthora cinnamomi]
MSHLEGSARVRAESYWYAWVSPTLRAVASGQPLELKILSRTGRSEYRQGDASQEELLYAPGNAGTFDNDRRNALCWVGDGDEQQRWPSDKDRAKAQWRMIPVDVHTDTFMLQSVRFEEYLYSADYAKFKKDARGKTRSRVFTWRKTAESPGPAGKWQLVALSGEERDVFALYNPYQREFLYAPTADLMDSKRRHVLTRAAPDGTREASNTEGGAMWCAWRIAPAQQSPMEKGVEAFFAKKYPVAVDQLTLALNDLPDNTEHVKCFAYRMTANLRLRRFDLVAPDFQAIQALGGDKAAIFHGLAHLWEENASYLASMAHSSPDLQIQAIEISTSPDNPFFMRHQLAKGDDYFVRRDFQAAIVCYQEAATCNPTIASTSSEGSNLEDPETTRQRVRAYLSCAKCFYALEESENAWQYLSIAHDIAGVSVEGEAAILLWKGKCKRVQKAYDESLLLLEKAFDRASAASAASACLPSSAAGAPMSAAVLKRSILMEMKVVGLLRQGVYDTLLSADGGATADHTTESDGVNGTSENDGVVSGGDAEKTLTQMMEIFHCPLSLELMDEPVTTPDAPPEPRAQAAHGDAAERPSFGPARRAHCKNSVTVEAAGGSCRARATPESIDVRRCDARKLMCGASDFNAAGFVSSQSCLELSGAISSRTARVPTSEMRGSSVASRDRRGIKSIPDAVTDGDSCTLATASVTARIDMQVVQDLPLPSSLLGIAVAPPAIAIRQPLIPLSCCYSSRGSLAAARPHLKAGSKPDSASVKVDQSR